MKQIARRLTYANVMSSIAVFLVLGGATAFAASTVAKNSVGSSQLKKNSVGTNKLKEESITTAKLRTNSVIGSKINLSTLGTVPSATNATTAQQAVTATTAQRAVNAQQAVNATTAQRAFTAATAEEAETATNFSRYSVSGLIEVEAGQTEEILTVGPFTVWGTCNDFGGGEYEAYSYMTTTQAGSSVNGYMESFLTADFEPGVESQLSYPPRSKGPKLGESYGSYETGFTAISGDSQTLVSGDLHSAVHMYGAACVYWASATLES